ncbi:response regulator [Desulfovibrio sulfodismutans]|jgi:two-component system chemotaxis response regulator CheY|uniref:Response regulator n=1 Tax=Desulfolutivibrio sulfodismutans TaxID=63561 RepID=A0A7K3NGT4_9BACT|nr:response regulator [Desulfolutivibrio sulfodismutans]NDY55297.1 response regulator [Desulfolutivibrio sulfodismutans]QLA12680.1 response regulator [Desulfolutivibrio sulfodismutans DSM 3696]
MRALIVDDDFYSRSFLEYIMHPYAFCDVAVNGEEAVMAFQKALEEKRPFSIVFMDLLMPVIDGPKALREIREIERDFGVDKASQARVIITSVLEDAEDTHNAMYLGEATSFLQKPVDEKSVLSELRRLGLVTAEEV